MSKITLNKDQKNAVQYFGDKPLLIDAGPGSGKTRVVIERVKFLVNEKNIDPESLLIITFSNKAAAELMDRLVHSENGLDKETVNKMHISTIHSFCHTLLGEYGIYFDILGSEESDNMFIYKNLKKLGFVDEKSFKKRHTHQLVDKYNELTSFKVDIDEFEKYVYDNFPVSEEYLDFIQEAMDNDEEEYFTFPEQEVKDNDFKDDWYNARYQHICESYRNYLKFLNEGTYIDYALLQTTALELLESTPNLVSELKYKNILIDEFQDTDPVQMKIFEILIKNAETFTVVGDDEQSIYAFRGSSVKYFKEFEKKQDAKVIYLRENYRSTESIVNFTENFIKEDRDSQSTKSLHGNPDHEGPERSIYHLQNQNRNDEAENIAKLIKFLKKSGKISKFGDIGILSRAISGGKISSLIKSFKDENIPYEVVGNQDLLEKDEIKSILLLFYYLVEKDEKAYIMNKWESQWLNLSGFSSEAFNALRMINLSESTRNILLELENRYKNKVIETEKEVYKEFTGKNSRKRSFKGIFDRDEEILIEIFNRVKKPFLWKYNTEILREIGITDNNDLEFFNELYNLRKELEEERENENVKYENISTLLNVFYRLLNITGYLNTEFVEDETNFEELGNLGIISKTLYNLEDVITRTNLPTMFWYIYHNIENYDSRTIDHGDEVQILTVHKSKGLEFPVVIVYDLQKDVFPSKFRDDENKLTGLMGAPLFPVPDEFAEYKEKLSLEEKKNNDYLEERRILYVAMTRAEDILVLSTRLDRKENMVEIKGINFDSLLIPEINEDFSILPKTQCKDRKTDKEILSLSYTSLKSYETCPFKYHLKYDLTFAESETIFIKKGHMVHKFLDKIHRKVKNNEDFNLDEMIEKHTTENDRSKNKKEIENIYKYVEKDLKGIKILESELPFVIEEGNYIVEGKIDLIYEKDGKIGIMDFKTTSSIDEEDAKQQLYIYLMALNENPIYAGKIDELAIYLVNSQKIKTFEVDEEYLKNLQTNIKYIVKEINNNTKFYKKRGTHCKTCTFNFICENESTHENINKKHNTEVENRGANHTAIDKLITNNDNKKADISTDSTIKKEHTGSDEDIQKTPNSIDKEKLEKERLDKERIKKDKLEKEKIDKEKLQKEKEKLEKERLKKERLKKEKETIKLAFNENISVLKAYEKQVQELENIYQLKEKIAIEQIKKHFSPKEITYDRFIEALSSCKQTFYKQVESAHNILNIATDTLEKLDLENIDLTTWNTIAANTGHTKKVDEELKKRLNTIKSIMEQINELTHEFAINSGKESYSGEIEDLLNEMEKLIDSVKEYK